MNQRNGSICFDDLAVRLRWSSDCVPWPSAYQVAVGHCAYLCSYIEPIDRHIHLCRHIRLCQPIRHKRRPLMCHLPRHRPSGLCLTHQRLRSSSRARIKAHVGSSCGDRQTLRLMLAGTTPIRGLSIQAHTAGGHLSMEGKPARLTASSQRRAIHARSRATARVTRFGGDVSSLHRA